MAADRAHWRASALQRADSATLLSSWPCNRPSTTKRPDRFGLDQGLDQGGILLRGGPHPLLRGAPQARLHEQTISEQDRDDRQGYQHQGAGDKPDHQQEQQGERYVDQGRQGQGGEEIANTVELAQIVRKGTGGCRSRIQTQPEHAFKQARGQLDIGLAARHVDESTPKPTQDEVETKDQGDADRQYPQGFQGLIRYHPIVDVHHEQRAGDRKQIDQNRGKDHVAIESPRGSQRAPEPVALHHVSSDAGVRAS